MNENDYLVRVKKMQDYLDQKNDWKYKNDHSYDKLVDQSHPFFELDIDQSNEIIGTPKQSQQ